MARARHLPEARSTALGMLMVATARCWCGCRRASEEEPRFPERVEQECRTREGCQQLLWRLSEKRDFCYREYGTSPERPKDCDDNDLYFWALKDHIELTELRAQRQNPGNERQDKQRQSEIRGLTRDKQQLDQARQQWQSEREKAAQIDRTWRELDPRKCAIEGDEEACYRLVQFIALGDSPQLAEAKAALASGQKLIEERKKKGRPQ
jgi:hypothetical protein